VSDITKEELDEIFVRLQLPKPTINNMHKFVLPDTGGAILRRENDSGVRYAVVLGEVRPEWYDRLIPANLLFLPLGKGYFIQTVSVKIDEASRQVTVTGSQGNVQFLSQELFEERYQEVPMSNAAGFTVRLTVQTVTDSKMVCDPEFRGHVVKKGSSERIYVLGELDPIMCAGAGLYLSDTDEEPVLIMNAGYLAQKPDGTYFMISEEEFAEFDYFEPR
jgi:hypothetical protein